MILGLNSLYKYIITLSLKFPPLLKFPRYYNITQKYPKEIFRKQIQYIITCIFNIVRK